MSAARRSSPTEEPAPEADPYERYADDPVGFARDVLGVELWDKQVQIVESVRDNTRTAGRSGHKIGKSTAAAVLAWWWVMARPDGKVILTAFTERQVKGILWKELRRLWLVARRKGHNLGPEPAKDPQTGWHADDRVRSIHGFTTSSPVAMAGFSGANLLFIVDEASGVPDDIYEAIEGNLAGGGRVLALGNPTHTSGWFFEAFRTQTSLWSRYHISSAETPNAVDGEERIRGLATRKWIEEMAEAYGPSPETHPVYMVRVLGEFPEHAADSVVSLAALNEARRKWAESEPSGGLEIGVDVARYGDDETVIQPVRGLYAYPPTVIRDQDGPGVAAHVLKVVRDMVREGEKPVVRIDSIGVGSSAYDALRHANENIEVVGVNVGESATNKDYFNLRSQVWFAVATWLKEGGAVDPDDDKLEQELLAPRFGLDPRGRIKVESKDDIRKRLKRSPDRADALGLAVYKARAATGHARTGGKRPLGDDRPINGYRSRREWNAY